MAGIIFKPFRAYRPPNDFAQKVASPPYDVIHRAEARESAEGNPMSFLYVNKPEICYDDEHDKYADDVSFCQKWGKGQQVYVKGRENLDKWMDKGWLVQDKEASMYVYTQQRGDHIQRGVMGVVSAIQYDEGLIKKHEKTRAKKEKDRLKLIDHQNAGVGPVMLAYRKRFEISKIVEQVMESKEPCMDLKDDAQVIHKIWAVSDKGIIDSLQKEFALVPALYIADGHHRCKSASEVAKLRRKRRGDADKGLGKHDTDYFMAVVFEDEDLCIMEYNRIIKKLGDYTPESFLEALKKADFVVKSVKDNKKAVPTKEGEFSVCFKGGDWYRVTFPPKTEEETANVVKGLDVARLTEHVLTPLLGIKNIREDDNIDFVGGVHGTAGLEEDIKKGKCELAFAMYSMSMATLLEIADAVKLVPPKATWFEPKLLSGLCVRVYDGEHDI